MNTVRREDNLTQLITEIEIYSAEISIFNKRSKDLCASVAREHGSTPHMNTDWSKIHKNVIRNAIKAKKTLKDINEGMKKEYDLLSAYLLLDRFPLP